LGSDLDSFITIPNVNVESGFYQIVNKAFKGKVPDYKDENYIKIPNEKEDYNKIGTIDPQELAYHIKQAIPFVGHDELKPVLTGVHLIKESFSFSKLRLYATNTHILYRVDIDDTNIDKMSVIIPNPKLTSLALENMDSQKADVFIKKANENIMFISNIMYNTRLIEQRLRYFEAVYKNERNKVLYMDGQRLLTIINSIKKEKDRTALIFKPIDGIKESGKFELLIAGKYLHNEERYETPVSINEQIEYRIENKQTDSHENVGIIMGMAGDESSPIVFDYNYLKIIIQVTEPELGLMFNEGNQFPAYHFNIRP